jgi:hypothetical protein
MLILAEAAGCSEPRLEMKPIAARRFLKEDSRA